MEVAEEFEVPRWTQPPDLFCPRKKQVEKEPSALGHCELRLFSVPGDKDSLDQTILN